MCVGASNDTASHRTEGGQGGGEKPQYYELVVGLELAIGWYYMILFFYNDVVTCVVIHHSEGFFFSAMSSCT